MIKFSVCVFIILAIGNQAFAKRKLPESKYQSLSCNNKGGKMESSVYGGRIDCETDAEVIEYDFADKWSECIGQSLFYAAKTGKKGVCLLILERRDYLRYVHRAKQTIEYHDLDILLETIDNY